MFKNKRVMVIYHGPYCPDGFTGAWVAYHALRAQGIELGTVYHPITYGDSIPDVSGFDVVYLIDFCFEPSVIHDMAGRVEQLVILDHHETAQEALDAYQEVGAIMPDNITSHIRFDVSGAVLAWRYFNNLPMSQDDPDMPALIRYVSDNDLWNHDLPESKEIANYIQNTDKTFGDWDDLSEAMRKDFDRVVRESHIISVVRHTLMQEIVDTTAVYTWVGAHAIWTANTPIMYSQVADMLIKGKASNDGVAATWYNTPDGIRFSVRSQEGCYVTAKEIAEKFGGGGHVHAAGFELTREAFRGLVTFVK